MHLGNGPVQGGDFSFAADGWVMELRDGDVLIYNPTAVHGTTEFEYAQAADGCMLDVRFFLLDENVKRLYNQVRRSLARQELLVCVNCAFVVTIRLSS